MRDSCDEITAQAEMRHVRPAQGKRASQASASPRTRLEWDGWRNGDASRVSSISLGVDPFANT
jgi:hypothetical protein